MTDPIAKLRTPTQRAKSDVANKLVSMFLHELSRKVRQSWPLKIESEEYARLVRDTFGIYCPYCRRDLTVGEAVVEHLDGLNRYRVGLHVPGNVLVACKRCNNEKRRDDARKTLTLAASGWESFLSHDGSQCDENCKTCRYWASVWPQKLERATRMHENIERIRQFRKVFSEFRAMHSSALDALTTWSVRLYTDCQEFAESEIKGLLDKVERESAPEKSDRPA